MYLKLLISWVFLSQLSALALAVPTCETGAAAKAGDDFVSARFCKDGESIVIHYRAQSICEIEFGGGILTNIADKPDGNGHINGKWQHTLPGVYMCG